MTGLLDPRGTDHDSMGETVARMASRIRHRGPDDHGVWVDAASGVALGHRRLSIIDLSDHGHQPMSSSSGRYVLSYNGEIYNHREMRNRLEAAGIRFRGHSDTEVLLESIARWGLVKTLSLANGMFAFALWDRIDHTLYLARDRLGEKPMYYGWAGSVFVFGSELKALRSHPDFRSDIDRTALTLYLQRNCVPAPHTIFSAVRKLPPGSWITTSPSAQPGTFPVPTPYWNMETIARTGLRRPLSMPPADAVDTLHELLLDAVRLRMEADVPLGAFLSGGVDSSTVVALMQAQSSGRVKTFTVGFGDVEYDEAVDARKVADCLGTDHSELRVDPHDVLDVIPRLPEIYDEPFSDSSQIPTYLISRLTRQHVTVSLSGDGGDEAFAGYNRYLWCPWVWRRIRLIPMPLRKAMSQAIARAPSGAVGPVHDRLLPLLPSRMHVRTPGTKLKKLGEVLPARGLDDMYATLTSHWKEPLPVLGREGGLPVTDGHSARGLAPDTVEGMMYQDTVTYLPDDILTKVDRATMACGLEARVPFLDHRVIELAWRIPLEFKIQGGESKWLLRQVLHRYVPRHLVDRPKMGFGLPLSQWLRGPLRPWAEELLAERRLRREGFLDPVPIRRIWAQHITGNYDFGFRLWDVLMFQAWLASG